MCPAAMIISNIMQAHFQSLATAGILMPLLFTFFFYRSFSFSFLSFFFCLFFFFFLSFLLFFFLHFNLKIAGSSSLNFLPLPKYEKIISSCCCQLYSPKFPCRRHKWHIRFEIWQYCTSFQEKKEKETASSNHFQICNIFLCK